MITYNKKFREDLKEVQVRCRKLGYDLDIYANSSLYLKRVSSSEVAAESYIRVFLRYVKVSGDYFGAKFCLEFVAEPCKIPGGSNYMSIPLAESVCAYWKRAIKECKYLNNLKVIGTNTEFLECFEDIKSKSRV